MVIIKTLDATDSSPLLNHGLNVRVLVLAPLAPWWRMLLGDVRPSARVFREAISESAAGQARRWSPAPL